MKEKIEKKKKILAGILMILLILTPMMTGCIDEIKEEVFKSLTIEVKGQGTTDPVPGNHSCLNGTQVTITAIPDTDWKFNHWEDDLSGTENPASIIMDSDKKVTACFRKTEIPPTYYSLVLEVNGQGTTDPTPGIHSYLENTQVTITAVPDTDWKFNHWTGDATGSQNPVTVTMTSDKEVAAHFEEIPVCYDLTILVNGQGTTNPVPGIHDYPEGTEVTIEAIPDTGWQFSHWAGDATGSQNPVTVTMTSDKKVTAHFEEIPVYELIIRVSGNGTTDPGPGSHNYTEGTQVNITAIPDTDWEFDYWSEDANGSQNPITITMDSDKKVTAHFLLPPPCKVYGLNFGPYTKEGQNPNKGTVISEKQIRELITIIAPYTEWVRTYGTENGLEHVGRIAHEFGLKVAVGAWLSDDLEVNENQIANLIAMANAGEADLLIPGTETLLRHDLTEDQLIEYINRVKENTSGIPVATADVYSKLLNHPAVMDAGDVVLPNYYPFWEGVNIEYAVYHIHLWHQKVTDAAEGKEVLVAETGWPSDGDPIGDAVPSPENAAFFFLNFVSWAKAENVDYFYFEAFDEPWKAKYEGSRGAHWGVWDKDGYLKPGMEKVFNCETTENNWGTEIVGGPGDPSIEFTYVPPYGSFDNLKGKVLHVKPADYRVTVYIKVNNRWWGPKPYWNRPKTIIWPDGTWICDITTGGVDETATNITAFLIERSYDPQSASGRYSILEPEIYENALAEVFVERSAV